MVPAAIGRYCCSCSPRVAVGTALAGGVHVNVSGAGVTAEAVELMAEAGYR